MPACCIHQTRPLFSPSPFLVLSAALALSAAAPEARLVVVSPQGLADGQGTSGSPASLETALSAAKPGDTVQLRGGTYAFARQVTVERNHNGEASRRICLFAAPGEKPMLDFSSQPYAKEANPRGLQINGNFWHVRGLEVKGSADNGIYVAGNDNIVEACVLHKNRDTGLQIGRWQAGAPKEEWPRNNLILNCESFDNYDLPPGGGENADGFACKLTSGEGNVFRGCIAHHNIDDGWDLFTKPETGPIGTVVIDRCIAYANGVLTDGTSNANGDRNGFKLGGSGMAVPHTVTRSVAFRNGKNGFTWNSNPGLIRMTNNLAFDNVQGNYKFGDNSTPTQAVFTNNISFWTSLDADMSDKYAGTDVSNSNCWWDKSKPQPSINGNGLVVKSSDFAAALANPQIKKAADGGPDFSLFQLAAGSPLLNAGVTPEGELPFKAAEYYQGRPDLGAVEKGAVVSIAANPSAKARAQASSPHGGPVAMDVLGRRFGLSRDPAPRSGTGIFPLSPDP